ncbi:Transglutaminase-like enzyme, putative cysteine protease [Persephonella hydrogeniphila]|uniref:Transglutaminase-like enzyme, putative cysteine protease n=1 Tax=Persephonella hydrogeniphila TaxID=198703 RepID=A0A285NS21_9AQUI|nr:transglutaminase family protein [Persephonella hydrogeniphila]SNZ11733.1 Transglutaminase-like enzyme, putative cysteine protease [Persephonella hydrogeniphila]
MITYDVRYLSENSYSAEVKEAIFDFLVLPADTTYQRLKEYRTENSLKENIFEYRNLFGFKILRIRTSKIFRHFSFLMESKVDVIQQNPFDFKPLPLHKELEILNSDRFKIENFLFLRKTKYTYVSEKNKEKFLWYKRDRSIFEFLVELNSYVHNLIDYCTISTDVHTVADQVFEIEKGVCQDYAHIFISIARENGIPARYVSGYLNQGKGYIGDAFMHAWVEALIPGVGWKGFDPTNNLLVEHNYIKVAHGEDYNDCAPIKGVIKTSGISSTHYSVKVMQEQ